MGGTPVRGYSSGTAQHHQIKPFIAKSITFEYYGFEPDPNVSHMGIPTTTMLIARLGRADAHSGESEGIGDHLSGGIH